MNGPTCATSIRTEGHFPPKDELWPTFEGYSIGHWEGDTLVIQTVSIRGGIPIDRTGAALSDEARVFERIRKTDDHTLQSDITIEDPVAFTGPWKVTRRYTKRQEQYPRMENVSSLENQRNPLVNGQTRCRCWTIGRIFALSGRHQALCGAALPVPASLISSNRA